MQGTAEGEPVPRAEIDAMVDLGMNGVTRLIGVQREVLARAGVDFRALIVGPEGSVSLPYRACW